jgi:pimeloyl-ACP methyl ester carboxylesterase
MPLAPANGIELCYDTFGDPDDPALLLVMGFTAQMTAWDEALCTRLADRGLHVIRFDNRDCGLSTHLDGVPVDLMGVLAAFENATPMPEVPYTLRRTPSGCSTTSASSGPTSPARRWAA